MTAPELSVYQNGVNQVSGDGLNTFEQTCNNVVDLRAFVGTEGLQVYMRGYVTPGDDGQGVFYWNAAGTGPDDDGVTNIVPNGAAVGCWTRLGIPNNTLSILPPTFRNGLINGDASVAQLGTSFTGINGSTPTYTLDQWFGWTSGAAGNMTISQQSGIGLFGFNNVLRCQRAAGSTSTATQYVGQIIPTRDCYRYQGKDCTLSIYVRAGANFSAASSQITMIVQQGTGTNDGSAALTAGTWTGASLALSQPQAITSTLTRYSADLTFISGVKEIATYFSYAGVGTAGASDYFEIVGIQLETGDITAYEYLPFNITRERCQEFITKTFPYATAPAQGAAQSGNISFGPVAALTVATIASVQWRFPVTMFKAATVTTYTPLIAGTGGFRDDTGTEVPATVDFASDSGCAIYNTNQSPNGIRRLDIHVVAKALL